MDGIWSRTNGYHQWQCDKNPRVSWPRSGSKFQMFQFSGLPISMRSNAKPGGLFKKPRGCFSFMLGVGYFIRGINYVCIILPIDSPAEPLELSHQRGRIQSSQAKNSKAQGKIQGSKNPWRQPWGSGTVENDQTQRHLTGSCHVLYLLDLMILRPIFGDFS